MPLYEYRCSGCGRSYEQLRKMQDADRELACPACGSVEVARQLSTFAGHVRGGGAAQELAPCGQPASACANGACRR